MPRVFTEDVFHGLQEGREMGIGTWADGKDRDLRGDVRVDCGVFLSYRHLFSGKQSFNKS